MDDSAILKMLSVRAVQEFEEMKAKCTEYHEKFVQDHNRVQKLEFQFKQLKRASLLAVSEYETLHKTYTAEVASRQDLEARLAKIDAENKHLRKANDYAPNTMIMRDQVGNSGGKGELEGLRGLVTGMKDELRRAKDEIAHLKEDLKSEQVSHEATQRKYRISQEHVKQLSSVSIMALEEYQELKKKHEIELECRVKAEEYASDMVRDKAIVDRKSRWFAEHTDDNETLKAALDDVDKVTMEAANEKKALETKITELQAELDAARDPAAVKDAEKKMSIALDQVDLMQHQLDDSEHRVRDLENENKSLHHRLEAAVAGICLPPPPPPPSFPAPIPGNAIRSYISKLGGKKKKVTGQPPKDDPRADAMAEMLERIKNGNVKLKSTRVETKQEDSAMGELACMLSDLRRGRAASQDSLDIIEKEEKPPEFQVVKLKKVVRKEPSVAKDDEKKQEVGELKKILDRKRSAAVTEKTPPTVAPKSDKVASLRQASVTDSPPLGIRRPSNQQTIPPETVEVKPATDDQPAKAIPDETDGSDREKHNAPPKPMRGQMSESDHTPANDQPLQKETVPPAASSESDATTTATEQSTTDDGVFDDEAKEPKTSNSAEQLLMPDDTEEVPKRPPRRKSSLRAELKPGESSTAGEDTSSMIDPAIDYDAPRKASLPLVESEHAGAAAEADEPAPELPAKKEPLQQEETGKEQQPEVKQEESDSKANDNPKADVDLDAAMDEIDQLLNELGS